MLKIFVVEDDFDDQYIIEMALQKAGVEYALTAFEDGKDLVDYLSDIEEEKFPGIILLDLNLPNWDGKRTLKVLKSDQRFKHIPVIIFTTSKSEIDVWEAYQLGANSYVVKPNDFEEILRTIRTICSYWANTVKLVKN